jgi:5-methylcytosine-specific restriction endonuclease McrA
MTLHPQPLCVGFGRQGSGDACFAGPRWSGKPRARKRSILSEAQGGRCGICGHPMKERPSLDHVIPHALGGKHGLGNYVAAHGECNGDKTNDVPTGCEMVWLLMVNAKLGVGPLVF